MSVVTTRKFIAAVMTVLAAGFTFGWRAAAAEDAAPAADPAPAPDAAAESAAADTAKPTVPTIPLKDDGKAKTDPEATHLDEVVVTARKRVETLQQVPVAVTAFNSKQMEQRGFTSLSDIAANTPGFTFESFASGGAHSTPVIRGLANQFTTTRIQNVSFFLDGVYLQRQSMLNLGMLDMERIEVVKGPQNALYGRNAFAGAVNYITLEPSTTSEGYAMATIGDNKRREYKFGVSGPVDQDATFLGKFTYGTTTYDGDTPNHHPINCPGFNEHHQCGNLGGWDNQVSSASLVYQPWDDLKLRGSFYHNEQVSESPASYSLSGINVARFGLRHDSQVDLNCNQATVPDIAGQNAGGTHTGNTLWCGQLPKYASDVAPRTMPGIIIDPRAIGTTARTNALTFSTDYKFIPAMSLHYLYGQVAHRSYTDGGASDEDPLAGRGIVTDATKWAADHDDDSAYTFINTSSSRPNTELQASSHEIRLDWDFNDRLRTSFGGYYSTENDAEWTELFIMDLCNTATPENIQNCNRPITWPNTVADHTTLTSGVAWDQYTRQSDPGVRGEWSQYHDRIVAVFGSANYEFRPTLKGALEMRYNVELKEVTRLTDSFALEPGRTVTYNPPAQPVLPFGNSISSQIVVPHDAARFPDFTPRAILNWDWADNHMVYGSVAKGTKAGGFNNANTVDELKYKEETNWTFELGSKNQFFHHLYTLNAALYYTDWKDLQAGVPPAVAGLSTSDVIANVVGATSVGLELDGIAHLTEAFFTDATFTYNDPKYKPGATWGAGKSTGNFHCNGSVCPASGDIGGNQIMRTSKIQASAGLNYVNYLAGWTMTSRLDASYRSLQYVEPLNVGWVPARTLANASFNFMSPGTHWEIGGWCKNLTDVDYAANVILIGVFNQYLVGKGPARTFGANVKYKF